MDGHFISPVRRTVLQFCPIGCLYVLSKRACPTDLLETSVTFSMLENLRKRIEGYGALRARYQAFEGHGGNTLTQSTE